MSRSVDFGNTVFLVGAGVSIDSPSGVPPAWPVIELLCRWIVGRNGARVNALLDRCRPGNTSNPFQFIRLEALLGAIEPVAPQALSALRLLETHGLPNAHHRFLAGAVLSGARLITTNFDTRIEEGLRRLNSRAECFVLSSSNPVPLRGSRFVKIHGSFPYGPGRRSGPRATLNGIGGIGLGFSHFPRFVRWFEETTRDARMFVLGYSASDSFDVVPLLESGCRARRLEWFDFRPTASSLSSAAIFAGDSAPLPQKPIPDFVDLALSRLKGLHPSTHVERASGPDLGYFLSRRFGGDYREQLRRSAPLPPSPAAHLRVDSSLNLSELRNALSEISLDREQRNALLRRLLDDGAYGEAMTRPLDEHKPDIPFRIAKSKRTLPEAKRVRDAERRFAESMDQEKIAAEFRNAERWFELAGVGDDPELRLMLANSEFDRSLDQGDVAGMVRARKKAAKHARRAGVIWGLVDVSRMEALEADARFQQVAGKGPYDVEPHRRAIEQARAFCYYAFRTGRSEWIPRAVWALGALADVLRLDEEAVVLHTRLLDWIPAENGEERGVTLSNLVSFALSKKDGRAANRWLARLRKISRRRWPMVDVFVRLAEADVARAARRYGEALEHVDQAEKIIRRRFPNDPWRQLAMIERLRAIYTSR